jgi:3-oxoacyl-[acyl-carrier protein] reductase
MGLEAKPFEGKVVVVTGASRGIGAATAIEFAEQGARGVVLVSTGRNAEKVEEVAHYVEAAGAKALTIDTDLSKPEEPEVVINAVKSEFKNLNVLVNNAGVTRDTDLLKMTTDNWDTVMNTNLRPAFFLSRYALRAFPKVLGTKLVDGAIINNSSIVGIYGNSGQENYAAAKAGLIALTQSLAHNMGRKGVRVNSIAPGFIDTDMTAEMHPEYKDDILTAVKELTPLGRLGTVQDIADLITFLASDRAGFITGQTIIADGGLGGKLHAVHTVMSQIREIRKLKASASN